DCAACHMPRSASGDIVHAAATDHRILVSAKAEQSPSSTLGETPPSEYPLVLFHNPQKAERDDAMVRRDLGIALSDGGPDPSEAMAAVQLLESALKARPDDTAAWESMGIALGRVGRYREGLAAYKSALSLEPNRESALAGAAYLAATGSWIDIAIGYLRRTIKINPQRAAYRAELAPLYFHKRDWTAAIAACKDALRLNSADARTRLLLVRCYLRIGDIPAARAEFQILSELDFTNRDNLRRSFPVLASPD